MCSVLIFEWVTCKNVRSAQGGTESSTEFTKQSQASGDISAGLELPDKVGKSVQRRFADSEPDMSNVVDFMRQLLRSPSFRKELADLPDAVKALTQSSGFNDELSKFLSRNHSLKKRSDFGNNSVEFQPVINGEVFRLKRLRDALSTFSKLLRGRVEFVRSEGYPFESIDDPTTQDSGVQLSRPHIVSPTNMGENDTTATVINKFDYDNATTESYLKTVTGSEQDNINGSSSNSSPRKRKSIVDTNISDGNGIPDQTELNSSGTIANASDSTGNFANLPWQSSVSASRKRKRHIDSLSQDEGDSKDKDSCSDNDSKEDECKNSDWFHHKKVIY